jgi:hypothetical protein
LAVDVGGVHLIGIGERQTTHTGTHHHFGCVGSNASDPDNQDMCLS